MTLKPFINLCVSHCVSISKNGLLSMSSVKNNQQKSSKGFIKNTYSINFIQSILLSNQLLIVQWKSWLFSIMWFGEKKLSLPFEIIKCYM